MARVIIEKKNFKAESFLIKYFKDLKDLLIATDQVLDWMFDKM